MKHLHRFFIVLVFSGWAGTANSLPITVGFELEIFGGGSFASVTTPSFAAVPQVGPYEVALFDNVLLDFVVQDLLVPGESFDFGPGGVDRFRITGINESLMLDPLDPLAFPLGISLLAATPSTDVTATPLTVDTEAVPAPVTLALFGIALTGLGWSRRRKA